MPTFGTVVATSSTTSTSPAVPLVNTTVGAVNAFAVSANSTGTGVQPQIQVPSGWTLAPSTSAWKTGSPSHEIAVVYRQYQSGDPTSQTVSIAAAGGGNIAVAPLAFAPGELDSTTLIVTGESTAANAAGPTTDVTSALTLGGARHVITVFGNRSGATWSAAADGNVHDTIQTQGKQSSAASIAVCYPGSTTSSGAARSLLSSASTSVNNTAIVAFNPATVTGATVATTAGVGTAVGASSTATGGAGASATVSTTAGVSVSVGSSPAATTWVPTTIITRLTSGALSYVAHRDGYAATYGEGTLEGYTAAVGQYSQALPELPVRRTSDGVWVVSHDATTGRVFSGANVTISAVTWASISGYTTIVGGNPIRRLTDILAAFPTGLFVVDNKPDTNAAELTALLVANAPGRWMGKQYYTASATWATACQNAGAPIWLYFYPADLGNLASTLANLSAAKSPIVFGLGDYSTAPVPVQSDANTFFAFTTANRLLTWAHILSTSGQKSTADSQAAAAGTAFNGYMISAYSTLAPTDSSTVTATAGVAVGVGGRPSAITGITVSTTAAPGVGVGAASSGSATSAVSAVISTTAGVSVGTRAASSASAAAGPAAVTTPTSAGQAVGVGTSPAAAASSAAASATAPTMAGPGVGVGSQPTATGAAFQGVIVSTTAGIAVGVRTGPTATAAAAAAGLTYPSTGGVSVGVGSSPVAFAGSAVDARATPAAGVGVGVGASPVAFGTSAVPATVATSSGVAIGIRTYPGATAGAGQASASASPAAGVAIGTGAASTATATSATPALVSTMAGVGTAVGASSAARAGATITTMAGVSIAVGTSPIATAAGPATAVTATTATSLSLQTTSATGRAVTATLSTAQQQIRAALTTT